MNDQVFYQRSENNSPEASTAGKSDNFAKQVASQVPENLSQGLAKMATEISTPRLFLILTMFVYAVLAYSKNKVGVQITDLSILVLFIFFIVLMYFSLMISQLVYRNVIRQIDEILDLTWYKKVFIIFKKIVSQRKKLFLFLLIIFFSIYLYVHENEFINISSSLINKAMNYESTTTTTNSN